MSGCNGKNIGIRFWLVGCLLSCMLINAQAGTLELFPHREVKLLESPFKDAMEVDLDYILQLDPDRLLYPFKREAGLETKAQSYPNWEDSGLDGHIGGHYLTALSLMYAATDNQVVFERLAYMLSELKKVQQANGGYIGGVPGSKVLWEEIAQGQIDPGGFSLNQRWVPLYNIHKTYAGLRDAYQIGGIEEAREMLIAYTDWMLEVTAQLSDEQIQQMLISEHGGLNEVFADVYDITKEDKYLELAYRFSHKTLLEPLENRKDVLNGMHANTQIPKVIGFETISALDGNQDLHQASEFFWDNVVNKRSVVIGGNSVREHFHPIDDFSNMVEEVQGPETCNTYNMMRLSEKLFLQNPDEKYVAYYENALYNHILASQHPEKGGFVYFTPMRPGHYRVYSQPETSFWCCVGSGIENHGKYNAFIYAHSKDMLYVNLFIPSTLNWEEKGLQLIQENNFPEEAGSSMVLKLEQPRSFTVKLRYPGWAQGFEVYVNNEAVAVNDKPGSFISIERLWKDGDTIRIKLPMEVGTVRLPDGSNYKAFTYGPLVLATKTGQEDLKGLFADASRGGHIASGKKLPLSEVPTLVVSNLSDDIAKGFKQREDLKFKLDATVVPATFQGLVFEPFYRVHDTRYAIYLPMETPASLEAKRRERIAKEQQEQRLESMTVDYVAPGEQQPESDHGIKMERSNSGINGNRHWRDASGWFSYTLKNAGGEAEKVRITYFGPDTNRNFKILVNGVLVAEEFFLGDNGETFFDRDYELPTDIKQEQNKELEIKFQAVNNSRTAGIYGVRLMKN